MIYLLILGLPVILAFLADETKGTLSVILIVMALFVPCFFAGVRDETVGTDVLTYGIWTFRAAESQDFDAFMQSYITISAPGFNVLSWLMAQTGSFELYLGAIQALTVCPLYLYARRRCPGSSWAAMAAYMLLLFPISLNAMKQMIAVSLCVLSYGLIERKKPLAFVIYILAIALLFHQTAIVFLVIYPVVRLMMNVGSERRAFFGRGQRLAVGVFVLLLFGVVFIFGNRLIEVVSPIKESYAYQAQAEGSRLNYSALVMTVAFVVAYVVNGARMGNLSSPNLREQAMLGFLCVIGSLAFQLNMVANSLLRFAYYPIGFVPLYASSLVKVRGRAASQVAAALVLIFLAVYFIQVYVINGGNAVFPYTSAFLEVR